MIDESWTAMMLRAEKELTAALTRIRELEAEVRALRSAGYSCPTCGNDAVDSVANVTDSGGSEHG
jgi:anaerobic ribonucleoside-triphosphate reductase